MSKLSMKWNLSRDGLVISKYNDTTFVMHKNLMPHLQTRNFFTDMVIFDSFPQPPKVATELTEYTAPDVIVVTELTTESDCSK